MESKTKHRILGVIVIAAIVVIAYPFMQNRSILSNEKSLVSPPPFPDQAIQVSTTDIAPTVPLDAPVATEDENNNQPVEPDSSIDEQPHGSIDDMRSSIIDTQAPILIYPLEPTDKAANADMASKKTTEHKVETKAVKSLYHTKAVKIKRVKKPEVYSKLTNKTDIADFAEAPLDNNGLMKLKKAAWVIQLGSFKDKTNALRLVNKLRSKGYRAFIQKYAASTGDHTRVFVGPEHVQKSARLVANELRNEMKLHGIVISYKPFTL